MKFTSLKRLLSILLLLAISFSVLPPVTTTSAATREPVRGHHGMVASNDELASKVGVEIMKKGGNAVDAAIAVGLALAVVFPFAGNIGGGGFMLIRKKDGTTTAIDYREMAPKAATRNIYLDKNGKLIKGEGGSILGYRSAGVPGTIAGYELALKKYGSGKIKWSDLVEPARLLAQNGFAVPYSYVRGIAGYKDDLSKYPDSKRIFLNGGKGFEEGDRLVQPELAQTLGRIGRLGPREFYTGKTAQLITADMKANNGLVTLEDLKNYQAKERKPVQGTYRGYEIISMPPPSSGGAIMLEILNILEGYDLRSMGYNSAAKYHVVTEAMRRAFADRAEYMGDADFVDVPVDTLIDKKYAAKRRESIDLTRASSSSEIGHGQITGAEPTETTHYTVVDSEGNIVSNTYTINNGYGSAATVKGAGFLLNDEMDDFAAQPGTPNMFGLIQGERNAVQPAKRPLSAMTPTIVLRKDGTPWFALGAAGGPTIITAVLLGVINVIDHDMNIQQALDMPRIHHQWMPDQLVTEPFGLSPDTRKILEGYGQKLSPPRTLARATGIMIDDKGVRLGAVDSRGPGEAVGY
ncbi:MAG TPA: gamma-glutamyltransferase [Pyrinomonadaceae bacterium]|nr:gamma-glutamyltransferase [Pyrinomonadaceae bacterium]